MSSVNRITKGFKFEDDNILFMSLLLQTQDLRVGQEKEPCIVFTQENSIENSVQDCLPYILISNDLCELLLAYSK